MTPLKTILLGLVASGLGLMLWLAGYHLYKDHVFVDLARANVIRQQQSRPAQAGMNPAQPGQTKGAGQ